MADLARDSDDSLLPALMQEHGPASSPGEDEVLWHSERTRVFRRQLAQGLGSIICKEPLGPNASERLRHERRILARLAGIEGVARLADVTHPANVIALQDSAGVALTQELCGTPMAVPALLSLALQLAHIIAAVHRAGVVHRDINPANILLCGAQRQPLLIDFHLATTFAEEQPGFTHHRHIAGTLAYLAPEQSGRTGRTVDQRADLYALGATFYELATGQPPFAQQDALRLIHDHLAHMPTPPITLAPEVPQALSDVILRLLEKEPERRYQSAEGLAHDLSQILETGARQERTPFVLGLRDFALRLAPPSRLIGRDTEIAALETALEKAVNGQGHVVLVSGAPGVGKTALINTLRPLVTARRGWFVSGKFDQFQHDAPPATVQALRALGRLLLAEPEGELAKNRDRILAALGPHAGLITTPELPEFVALLGKQPEAPSIDPVAAGVRLRLATLGLLRAIVSPARPVVMVLDDLQWARAMSIRLIDSVMIEAHIPGLLLVGAYREAEVDAAHPLSAVLPRWAQLDSAPLQLPLQNLPPSDLSALLAGMLRLAPAPASQLADALSANTQGNPFDTVELVNALRRDGVLAPGNEGWSWDADAIRRYVGQGNVVDLLTVRIARLSPKTQKLLEIMACLGGELGFDLLQAASGLSAAKLDAQLSGALEDGLLVLEQGEEHTLRFRHDRVQQAAYGALEQASRGLLHLAIARRLAADPEFIWAAAEQYLAAVADIHDPHERRRAAGLFRQAAAQACRVANYATMERFLAAAIALLKGIATTADMPLSLALEIERLAALYSLGRLDEADEAYRAIEALGSDALSLVDAACVQVSSLSNRGRPREAVELGLTLLRKLGLAVPRKIAASSIERQLNVLCRWVKDYNQVHEQARPDTSDPRVVAAAKLINRLHTPAFFCDPTIVAWLVLESLRLWVKHGPCAALVANLSRITLVTIALRQDYRTGYDAVRHALGMSEARGYEPETSQTRHLFAISAAHWFEPLERGLQQAQRAREGLLHSGDLQSACFTYRTSIPALLDCASNLESYAAEIESGLAFAARTGNDHATAVNLADRQLLRTLRGETEVPGHFTDGSFNEAAHLASVTSNPMAIVTFHIRRALGAILFSDMPGLVRHAAAAMPLLPFIQGFYPTALAHFLHALALAERVKTAGAEERVALLAELDGCHDWLARRAADCPHNFLHLLKLVEAERAWAVGDFKPASYAFDRALGEVQGRQRCWHQALITERAALFDLVHGMEHMGRTLLRGACQLYADWGASAKVQEMERRHPFLRARHAARQERDRRGGSSHGDSLNVSVDTIDLLAIVRASQALSSETSLERLKARVIDLLATMTGATQVLVVLRRDDPPGWYLSTSAQEGGAPVSVDDAGACHLLPLSAFRYVERTREPLLVEDVKRDDRFSHDPYFAALERCSLLLVPILSQGVLHAVLLLENRLSRGAFSTERLDAVMLIAGQLAVSLDNALLYASLERKVADRTGALELANRQLALLSITDPLTGLANRRRFNEVLEAEWLRALRAHAPMGAAMIDVDHFKLYNDHYGHLGGDDCLKLVAATLGDKLRQGIDLVARYGGEEFALILPGADFAAACQAAERARAAVAALRVPHAAASHGIVTVSIGVAALVPSPQGSAEQLFGVADAALYDAKQGGRNRVAGRQMDG